MSIILAVNGIVETYPVKPAVPQNVRADSLGEREHHGQQSSSLDRSVLAAQTAYEQQSIQRPHPKPAILARDLMNAPAVSLPSDSTLLDAWGIMSERDSTISLSLRCMAHSLGWYRIEIYFIMCPN